MIQANELRIGNKVFLDGNIVTIAEIEKAGATFDENQYVAEYYFLHAIPLTPEILEACGFDPPLRLNFWELRVKQFTLILIDPVTGNVWLSPPRVDIGLEVANCPFLHQLQNLFFALTASELPVTLQLKKA
jgi:hypothetical protein